MSRELRPEDKNTISKMSDVPVHSKIRIQPDHPKTSQTTQNPIQTNQKHPWKLGKSLESQLKEAKIFYSNILT